MTSDDEIRQSDGSTGPVGLTRRSILAALGGLGVGTAVFQRALAAETAASGTVTAEMVAQAAWIAGIDLSEAEQKETANHLKRTMDSIAAIRKVPVGYDIPPALAFIPAPTPSTVEPVRRNQATPTESHPGARPETDEALAFLPVTELSALVRTRQVTSTDLTKLYLARLKKYDPMLLAVVTLTEDLALKQAAKADAELAAGIYRGPLHGIPWGAKDLISYPGYPTTWGAKPFADRVIDEKATVASRLEEAGAVLVAKTTLGALANGDRWQGGRTRSPWDPRRGSSGSSAGSASTVAAGLVGFAIGSETQGSIISPCRACGASGLRPTFGRVSRHGCMTLAWSMDKLGPITRSVEDAALVLDAIHGADGGLDISAVDRPFSWPEPRPVRGLRVGYFVDPKKADADRDDLRILRDLGVNLVAIKLPEGLPAGDVGLMLGVEAATVFDDLTRQHISDGLNGWPASFRSNQFVSAVEYLRAARVRTLLMRAMGELMKTVDLYLGGDDLTLTNLTGHPSVIFPHGFNDRDGRPAPGSITFTGQLYGESTLLAVASAFQQAVGDHLKRPPLDRFLDEHLANEKEAAEKAAQAKETSEKEAKSADPK